MDWQPTGRHPPSRNASCAVYCCQEGYAPKELFWLFYKSTAKNQYTELCRAGAMAAVTHWLVEDLRTAEASDRIFRVIMKSLVGSSSCQWQ